MHTCGLCELSIVIVLHVVQCIVGVRVLVDTKIYFFVRIVSNIKSLNLKFPPNRVLEKLGLCSPCIRQMRVSFDCYAQQFHG